MKLDDTISEIRSHLRAPQRKEVERVITVAAAAASAIWVVLRLKRELYGPGGTRMSRYDPKVDEVWDREE